LAPKDLNERILQIEADEKMHKVYKKVGNKRKLVNAEVPIEYKHTSPYPIFDKCLDITAKALYRIEKYHELNCENPGMSQLLICKLFNKEWPKIDKE
jgi:hypothetical protein